MISEVYIQQILKKSDYKLLGQISVSDNDYDTLIEYARFKASHLVKQTIIKSDLMLALALVQIAIKRYSEGKYWPCFKQEIGIELSSNDTNYIGQIFSKTINQYSLFELPKDETGSNMYVENIKAHAFVTNAYMNGFFDFTYAFFENNLFRDISGDLYDDFYDLSIFMKASLATNSDSIFVSDDVSKGAAKSYRLLKSTRAIIANIDIDTIVEFFSPILKLMDSYFYDNLIPEYPNNRFEELFVVWSKEKDAKESEKQSKLVNGKRVFNHKPYIHVDVDRERSYLIIPQLKFRVDDFDGTAYALIKINGYTERFDLELYKSFGIYISEKIEIPISNIFDEITITVISLSEKNYLIKASNYRIFNDSWNYINRFSLGHNYLLVKPNIEVTLKNPEDVIDYSDVYADWQYYSVHINELSVFYIGNKPISIIGEFSQTPIFEDEIEYFKAYKSDKEIVITRSHPSISFTVKKELLDGTKLIINDEYYPLKNIKEKVVFDWPEDKNKKAVTIFTDSFLQKNDSMYCISIDVPTYNIKSICNYLFLKNFNCRFDKPRYMYSNEAHLKVTHGNHDVFCTNEKWCLEHETEYCLFYSIPLDVNYDFAEFEVEIDDIYKIVLPIKLFKYGFSEDEMQIDKVDYIWYTDVKQNLYLQIPGAISADAFLNDNSKEKYLGVKLSEGNFRIDVSQLQRSIEDNSRKKYHYINIEYIDNSTRRVSLPVILRTLNVDPYFQLKHNNDELFMDFQITGKADLFVKIEDSKTKEIVAERKPLFSGHNVFSELSVDRIYNFYPFMEEADLFGFSVKKTELKPVINIGIVDFNNLIDCRLLIKSANLGDNEYRFNYEYYIDIRECIDGDTYIGYMFGYKLSNSNDYKKRFKLDYNGKKIKQKLGKVKVEVEKLSKGIDVCIMTYSDIDTDWTTPYYDRDMKKIIHSDDSCLNSTNNYSRYEFLDENLTSFFVAIKNIKRIPKSGE